ncbi:MAG: TrmJ/YjtD family RNA methyltransferase [Pseudomonadota bacterium]
MHVVREKMSPDSTEPSAGIDFRRALLSHAAIVLVGTNYPENIGAAARVACNMGISRIILVRDEMPDQERMRKMATHHAGHLIDSLQIFDRLDEALSSFGWVVGTSARTGRQRHSQAGPRKVMADLVPKLENNRVALVFGPEDRGLTNEDLKFCNIVTTIPTADFASLNLAQAVALLSYELYSGVLQFQSDHKSSPAKLAMNREMENMYSLVEEALRTMNFLKDSDYSYWMHNIRHFLGRIGLRARDVRFVSGFCRQVAAFAEKNRKREE